MKIERYGVETIVKFFARKKFIVLIYNSYIYPKGGACTSKLLMGVARKRQ